jgi:hypothetical protein
LVVGEVVFPVKLKPAGESTGLVVNQADEGGGGEFVLDGVVLSGGTDGELLVGEDDGELPRRLDAFNVENDHREFDQLDAITYVCRDLHIHMNLPLS